LFDGFGIGLSNSSSIWEGKDLDPGMTYWDTDGLFLRLVEIMDNPWSW
jgi:hypothetical protein